MLTTRDIHKKRKTVIPPKSPIISTHDLHNGKLKPRGRTPEPPQIINKKPILTLHDKDRLRRVREQLRKPAQRPPRLSTRNTIDPLILDTEYVRELQHLIQPGAWKGRRCFIVGGGPSLQRFNWDRLKGELVIGINRAFEACDPAINVAMDTHLFGKFETGGFSKETTKKWNAYRGTRVWWHGSSYLFPPRDDDHPYDVYVVGAAGATQFPRNTLKELSAADNSGYLALNMAVNLGANPIYLLGFDMKVGKPNTHWHSGYDKTTYTPEVYDRFIADFTEVRERIPNDIEIYNLGRYSKLKCFPYKRSSDVFKDKTKRPIIISYYTKHTGYEGEANRLMQYLHLFGIEYDIEAIDSLGNWKRNTYYKAEFILKMLKKHNRDVVWLDADAVVRSYPGLFDNFIGDIGVHYRDFSVHPAKSHDKGRVLLSGTLYVSNTVKAKQVVQAWVALNRKKFKQEPMEQRNLEHVLKGAKGVDVVELPSTYCQIFDTMGGGPEEAVIEHLQASRRFRNEVST